MFLWATTGWTRNETKMGKNILIGITGGIGSGKSAVREYLLGTGENVICADEVSRETVKPGERGNKEIRRIFGDEYFLENGEIDRKKIAEFVFNDKEKLNMLNSILHPVIADSIFKKAGKLTGRVFIEAPLLIQADMQKKVDYVWLVTADIETRIKRVVERDGLSREQVRRRIESQMSDEEMAVFADEIIDNSTSLESLYGNIENILGKPGYKR